MVAVGGAVAVVAARSLVRAAVGLLAALAGAAGVFLALGSETVAALQVLIYVGGVTVLFLFAMMVTPQDGSIDRPRLALLLGIAGPVALAGLLLSRVALRAPRAFPDLAALEGSARAIGRALITSYLLPFEMVSLLLLAGLFGAVVVIRKEL